MFITVILWCFRDLNFYFVIKEEHLALTEDLLLIILFLSIKYKPYFRHFNFKIAGVTIQF